MAKVSYKGKITIGIEGQAECTPDEVHDLTRARIPKVLVAKTLGCTAKTLDNKIRERTPFSVPEAFKLKTTFFPTGNLDYLFATDNDTTN